MIHVFSSSDHTWMGLTQKRPKSVTHRIVILLDFVERELHVCCFSQICNLIPLLEMSRLEKLACHVGYASRSLSGKIVGLEETDSVPLAYRHHNSASPPQIRSGPIVVMNRVTTWRLCHSV